MLHVGNCFNRSLADLTVEEVRSDDKSCSTSSSMAVNEYSLAFLTYSVHGLHYHQQFRYRRTGEVLPIEVKMCNTDIVEEIRVVRKPNLVIYAFTTESVLSWLLKVDDATYIEVN